MARTSIEWCDESWNPVVGCTRVSAGCSNCYAEGIAHRFYPDITTPSRRWNGRVLLFPDRLISPLKWRNPRRIFVNSMSDLFHEHVHDGFVDRVFATMAQAQQHTFIVLTKRAERMLDYAQGLSACSLQERGVRVARAMYSGSPVQKFIRDDTPGGMDWPLPNVHLGVSVEDQKTADERIPLLLQTPAEVRIVSYEPALEPVDFTKVRDDELGARWNALECGLDQVIVGGESGPRARPFDINWARSVVQQCRDAGVACFVKQLGSSSGLNLKDRKGADPSEWPEELRVREFPVTTRG